MLRFVVTVAFCDEHEKRFITSRPGVSCTDAETTLFRESNSYQLFKMKSVLAASICASLLTMCLVKATPIYPEVHLEHFTSVDVCLFVCNICFNDMLPEMMDCANHVCLAHHEFKMVLGLLEVGRTCKNYSKLDAYLFGSSSSGNMQDTYLETNETV